MTSREQLSLSLSHRRPGRIPSIIDARREVRSELVKYFGVANYQEVLAILEAEEMYRFPTDSMIKIKFPNFEERAEVLEGPWLGGGKKYIRLDSQLFQDEWGVIRRIGEDGKYVQWISGPLADVPDLERYGFPEPSCIADDPDLPHKVQTWKNNDLFVRALVSQPFKTAWQLRGMENLLIDYAVNSGFVEELYDRIYALQSEILFRCTKARADLIGFDGDIATKDSIIMGPDRWRKIDKPRLASVVRRCKTANPGVYMFIHSDGNISEILPDLIEIGFDVIDPIQPECMDPIQVKKQYGDKITLHRCGSLQKTLPFGTPGDCREEAIRLIEKCGYDGGLVLGASNTIGFDVPIANIVSWYSAVRDFAL